MVCHMPVIEFSGTILDLWPSNVLGGLKWFSLEHLLEKSTSMYFHPRLLVVVGGIFGDLLGKYPSAKTPDHQQLLVENLMGTQVNKISKSDALNSTSWKEKGRNKTNKFDEHSFCERFIMGVDQGGVEWRWPSLEFLVPNWSGESL